MKLALVHDWLNQRGGAEDVLEELVRMFGTDTPIHTSIYAPDIMPRSYQSWDIHTTWMDRLPAVHTHHQPYLPLYPVAWDHLDLSSYDIILSNKSGFCHGFHKGDALHICYCLAPTRYLWQFDAYIQRERLSAATAAILRPVVRLMRRWDYDAAQQVDHMIAISTDIQQRISRYYNRTSDIIFPPVDTNRFQPAPSHDDYYLVLSRLVPYKRIDLAVRACTELSLPLKVAGTGRDLEMLREMAGPTVEFLGYVPDEDVPGLMARCKAFVFPGFEDFGITPVQAQAAGRPVIAYRGGGALDTVIDGSTGVFFDEQTVSSLSAALRLAEVTSFDVAACRANAERFDTAVFEKQLRDAINRHYAAHRQR